MEVLNYTQNGGYSAIEICKSDERVNRVVLDLINGTYDKDVDRFKSIYENLLTYNDEFFVLKDFSSYIEAQNKVDNLFKNMYKWQEICGKNIAHSGIFSSDRTIQEYVTGIWGSELIYRKL